jgi:serine/threonine-protein kinase
MLAAGVGDVSIDGYRLEEHVGSGGPGTVYRVVGPNGRIHAMKIADRELHQLDRQNSRRFEREARALSRISDPGVVSMTARGVLPDGRPYLVMDYLRGLTLQNAVAAHPLPVSCALEIVRATARALSGVHAAGIIHRDVSASNVLLHRVQGGVVPTLIDFGHAWINAADMSDIGDGCRHHVFGTPYYMSPEHIRGERVDERADLYGLGIVLYELIAGDPPFDGNSPRDVLREHLNEEVPTLESPHGPVPDIVDDIVVCCLEKNPADRYDSATDLVAALDVALTEVV